MRNFLLLILLWLLAPLALLAVTVEEPQVIPLAVPDSLSQQREQEILTEYGFKDTNTLTYVAEKLQIENLELWKQYLGLESANKKLDDMSLQRLDITPYRALLAQQYSKLGYTELSPLVEIARTMHIPIKKLKSMLGNNNPLDKTWDSTSLQALGFTPEDITRVVDEFNEQKLLYGASVTLVGMIVVFCALLITSLIISQLVHLNRPKKDIPTIKVNQSGKVKSAPNDLSRSVIVAAITALHIHKQEFEERRKMVLTFRRTPTNQWRASGVLSMPNARTQRIQKELT